MRVVEAGVGDGDGHVLAAPRHLPCAGRVDPVVVPEQPRQVVRRIGDHGGAELRERPGDGAAHLRRHRPRPLGRQDPLDAITADAEHARLGGQRGPVGLGAGHHQHPSAGHRLQHVRPHCLSGRPQRSRRRGGLHHHHVPMGGALRGHGASRRRRQCDARHGGRQGPPTAPSEPVHVNLPHFDPGVGSHKAPARPDLTRPRQPRQGGRPPDGA